MSTDPFMIQSPFGVETAELNVAANKNCLLSTGILYHFGFSHLE